MRSTAAILFLAAASVWADDKPLTWEPARIVRVEEAVASGVLAPTDPHPTFFECLSDAIPDEDGSVVFIANGGDGGSAKLGREGVYAVDRYGRGFVLIQKGDVFGDEDASVASITALDMRDGVPVVRCLLEDGSRRTFALESIRPQKAGKSAVVIKYRQTIYWSAPGGGKRIAADPTTRIPDLFEGAFTAFGDRIVAFGPWVVFSGSAKDFEGLFAMNMETGRLFLLIDNRSVLGDRKVEAFQMSKSPRSGEDLAVTVTFADGRSGIYLFRFGDSAGNLLFGS